MNSYIPKHQQLQQLKYEMSTNSQCQVPRRSLGTVNQTAGFRVDLSFEKLN
jgi:hypothetical protein